MSSPAYSRRKEPERVRQALIDGTASLVVERGLANVTVAAVSVRAGVTKGALFHHFADRDALIAAMFQDLLDRLDQQLDALMALDPVAGGRFTRAYVNAALADENDTRPIWAALIGSLVGTNELSRRWHQWMDGHLTRASGEGGPTLEAVRMAADGAWLAMTSGASSFDAERLRRHLLHLAGGRAG